MGNQTSQLIVTVEHHTVRARRTTVVGLSGAQNRPLIVRRVHREVEALVVVILVRVVVAADGLAGLLQLVTGSLGGGNGGGGVAVATAGVVTGALDDRGEGEGGGEEEGSKGQELLVFFFFFLVRILYNFR